MEDAPHDLRAALDAALPAMLPDLPAGVTDLWQAVRAARPEEARDRMLQALRAGVDHWRAYWLLARFARAAGDVACVDQACRAVTARNPRFAFARELPKHVRGYYSQANQELIAEAFFAVKSPRHRAFAEVGAFDGLHYSNVRRLHERQGWKGVSVEPVPQNYQKLARSYQGTEVRCVQAAVSDTEGTMELHVSTVPQVPGWGSDTATLVSGQTDKHASLDWRTETVTVQPLTRILDEAGLAGIDLLSVDAEGHDLNVLKSLDFARFRPLLIVVEAPEGEADRQPILSLLESQGYRCVHATGQDLFMGTGLSVTQLLRIRFAIWRRRTRIGLYRRLRSPRVDQTGFFLWSPLGRSEAR